MTEFRTLTAESPELPAARALYESAFPENERRSLGGMLSDTSGFLELLSVIEDGEYAGLLFFLNCEDIAHIIYFAVREELRDRGIGGRALELAGERKAGMRIILDIEQPDETAENNRQRLRRREFYFRHGFRESGVSYSWRSETYDILILGGELTKTGFFRFWKKLHTSGFSFGEEREERSGSGETSVPEKRACLADFLVNLAVVISVTWAVLESFFGGPDPLGAQGSRTLRYFTTDSNILAAITCLFLLPELWKRYKDPSHELSRRAAAWKFTGTVSVALTMLTVLFFLGPSAYMRGGIRSFLRFFHGGVFVLHLSSPVMCILSLLLWERTPPLSFRDSLRSLLPTVIYSLVYFVMVVPLRLWPDWYGFTFGGRFYLSPLIMAIMYSATLLIAFLLRRLRGDK